MLNFLLITATLFSPLTFAQGIRAPEQSIQPGVFDNFCGDPALAVCADLNLAPIGREERRIKLRERIQQRTLITTISQFSLPANFQMGDLKFYKTLDQIRINGFYRQAQINIMKFEISVFEYSALKGQIENVRKYLTRAINAQVSPLDPAKRGLNTKMLTEINRTVIIDSTKLEQMLTQGHSDANALLAGFNEVCGFDGMSDNAFASEVNSNKYLTICPGLLIGGLGDGFQNQNNFRNIIRVVGHEWGHHIDFRYFPNLYAPYLDCLAAGSAHLLKDPGQLGDDPRNPINLPESTAVRKAVSHAAEITAEYWGNQAISQFFFFNMQQQPLHEKLLFLRESHAKLCGSQDEGSHPTGTYRIGVLLRTDPAISYYMGCSTRNYQNIIPSCTLEGQYAPKLQGLKL
jgi:hypothetical protein